MQEFSDAEKGEGKIVGVVPTMGFLHEGHLSLIRECAKRAECVVMTLFVNPTQFAPHEDLQEYPRDFEGDCRKALEAGANAVFYPSVEEMYPEGFQTYVTVEEVTRDMEGEFRPVHFRGVATVCAKLFNAVRPRLAVFGEKDYQQLKVIERMVQDLNLGIEIIGLPTVREPDGMAMSSRNVYLAPEQRRAALSISRALFAAGDAAQKGERDAGALAEQAHKTILGAGLEIDYVEVRDARTLAPVRVIDRPARMLVAARIGSVRLIDNIGL
jgi:pantoate--beta-alanine ligase